MDTKIFAAYYQSTANFKICNPHPAWQNKRGFKWDRADCVFRALANATGLTWLQAFDYLTPRARRDMYVPNDSAGFRKWLQEDGATWNPVKAEKGKKRLTVLDFAKSHPTGRYVVTIANHDTAVVDGVILDAWNCGASAVVGFYDMTNFNPGV